MYRSQLFFKPECSFVDSFAELKVCYISKSLAEVVVIHGDRCKDFLRIMTGVMVDYRWDELVLLSLDDEVQNVILRN